MATRKDQLDAFVFARRRMVANLVAPSPTGSDEAAPRPVKTFFTSAILSAIAVAGVAVLGVFKPSAPSGWENGLAVDSSSGATYVRSPQDKNLHPVLNITSARLLLGPNFKKFDVPDNVINGANETIGAPLGIPGAPPDVPSASNVDLTNWTLCLQSSSAANQKLGNGKTILEVGYSAANESPINQNSGLVVHDSSNTNYLVSGDYAYPVADNGVLNVLTSTVVAQGVAEGPWVSNSWLKAFQKGTALQFPTLDGVGNPLPTTLPPQPGLRIGDYGTLSTTSGSGGYIETGAGLIQVNYFVYDLYKSSPEVSLRGAKLMSLTDSQVTAANAKDETKMAESLNLVGNDWPQSMVTPPDSDGMHPGFGVFCVTYSGTFDGNLPHLALSYGTELPQSLGSGGAGVGQSGGGSALADIVLVKPGHAALARDVSGGDSQANGAEYLITDTGTRYLMVQNAPVKDAKGQTSQTSASKQLQYDNVTRRPVPDNWVKLIQVGAALDPNAAGRHPTFTGQ